MNIRLDEFKSETFISIEMKISTINSNKYPFYYYQPSADIVKFPLLKSSEKINIHNNSPNIYLSWTYKATINFKFKNGGMPSLLTSTDICQQTRYGHNTNIS